MLDSFKIFIIIVFWKIFYLFIFFSDHVDLSY